MTTLADIEGIGPIVCREVTRSRCEIYGDSTKKGASAKGRKELAATTGISDSTLLEWVNHADLFRVR